MTGHMSLIVCLVVALLHSATAQDTHVILGSSGWTNSANGDGAYQTWAASEDFEIGDTLVFNFATGRHDVAEVNKAGYDSCIGASPISIQTTGPANVILRTSGVHYFICTVSEHCMNGQKLAVTVENNTDTPSPTSGTTTPPAGTLTPSPPPPPSAASVVLGGFVSALLSTVVAFVY